MGNLVTFVYTIVIDLIRIENDLKINKNIPLEKRAVVNIRYTSGIINHRLNDVLKLFEISIQQFNVLRILRGQGSKPVSLEIVQGRMINHMSNTTRLIDKLIKKGYVRKSINKKNERKIDITMTQGGLFFLDEIDHLIDSTESKIMGSLNAEELHEIIRLLGKIRLIAN